MCTPDCVQPREAGLDPHALTTLAALYEHPVLRLLARTFRAAGGQLFVVGGPVRDALRGRADFADLDFTTDLRPQRIRAVLRPLGTLWTSGEQFGTIGVVVRAGGLTQKVEVTTFRTETYTADSRKPVVGFGDNIGADLRRRDLTVNAMAMNVIDGCLVDPFGGAAALAAGVLDTPDDPERTLAEDPLRILRAIRFAVRLRARHAPRLATAVAATGPRLAIVSAERRLGELDRVAEGGPAALAAALALAARWGVLATWVPGAPTDPALLGRLAGCADTEEALAALHLGAGRTRAEDADPLLRAMKLPVARMRTVRTLIGAAADLAAAANEPAQARRLLRAHPEEVLAAAARVAAAATGTTPALADTCAALAAAEPQVRAALPLGGAELRAGGLSGPAIGSALRALEEAFCRTGTLTTAQARELVLPAGA